MSLNKTQTNEGYVAIISAVILTVVILTVAVSFSSSNFLARFDGGSFESKEDARAAAEGCLEYALLKLSANDAYAGNESVTIASSSCTLRPIITASGQKRIEAYAASNNKTTNLEFIVNENTLETVSLREVDSF